MKNEIEKYLSKFRGSESSYPFGPEALVFKVMGKMFALVSQEEDVPRVTLKCAPEDAATLTGQFKSVSPGYYMSSCLLTPDVHLSGQRSHTKACRGS
jgi:predicted DNA-binding protein (MmcQ/YjbR family)